MVKFKVLDQIGIACTFVTLSVLFWLYLYDSYFLKSVSIVASAWITIKLWRGDKDVSVH